MHKLLIFNNIVIISNYNIIIFVHVLYSFTYNMKLGYIKNSNFYYSPVTFFICEKFQLPRGQTSNSPPT